MSPDKDPVLLMLEELGMAIMHNDVPKSKSWEVMLGDDRMSWEHLVSTGGRTNGGVLGFKFRQIHCFPVAFCSAHLRLAPPISCLCLWRRSTEPPSHPTGARSQ